MRSFSNQKENFTHWCSLWELKFDLREVWIEGIFRGLILCNLYKNKIPMSEGYRNLLKWINKKTVATDYLKLNTNGAYLIGQDFNELEF